MSQQDRREFFRIEERLMLSYRRLASDQEQSNESTSLLLQEFDELSQQIKHSLSRLHYQAPEVSSCIKILDSKINLLAQSLLMKKSPTKALLRRKVNISGGGISFELADKLEEQDLIEIEIILPPEAKPLKVRAKVISTYQNPYKNSGYSFVVSARFHDLNDQIQDAIIRHITQAQTYLLRMKKQQENNAEKYGE